MDLVNVDYRDGVAVLTIVNPPVNALSAALRASLDQALAEANSQTSVKAIVISAEGRVFIAGADINELGKTPQPPVLPDLLNAIEASTKPVVAAINGVALGGGFEVALACHARVIAPGAVVGLPEIKLGLIPGAGGTQRLPRLIGPVAAFAMMRDGEQLPAEKAVALGVGTIAPAGELLATARARAASLAASGRAIRTRDLAERLTCASRTSFEKAAADALKRSPDTPNVAALVDAVRAGFDLPFDEAMAVERAQFLALIADPRSKALRHVFFAEREAARVSGISKETPRRPIRSAAVIGAGTMGGGIAMCFANAGLSVTIIEQESETLRRALDRIKGIYDGSVKRGSLTQVTRDQRVALITGQIGLEAAATADIVVEAALEDMVVKRTIFATLDRVAKPGAILATNTSYLDVNTIAAVTTRPGDVVGLHFFIPANVMRLLEVVRAEKTAPDVLATSLDLARTLGKLAVTVGVSFGFVGNRMLARRSAAAERLLLDGALPHEVDAAVTQFGFRMGPFAMADLAGLDIGWSTRKSNGGSAPVADALCEMGRFGQKTGRGFYRYPEGARIGAHDPEVKALIGATSDRLGISRRSISADDIIPRLMYPMVNEGARILDEKIAARPGDIDIIWINGYNWPSSLGGPMYWADAIGLPRVAAALTALAEEIGDESLRPAPLLARLAEANGTFAGLAAASKEAADGGVACFADGKAGISG